MVSFEPFGDKLVIGGKGGIYSFDGATFNLVFTVPTYIKVLGVYNNTLYAGTMFDKPPTLYYCNGSAENPSNWHIDTAFSTILNFTGPFGSIDCFAVFNNKMYISSASTIYCYNGTNWTITKTYGDVCAFLDMKVYNGKLYLAARDQAWRKPYYQGYSGFSGRVIEFNGNNWTTTLDHDYWIYSLETYHGRLYAGTANKIYEYNMTSWKVTFTSIDLAQYAISFEVYDDTIYVGKGNGYIYKYYDPSSLVTVHVEDPGGTNAVGYEATIYNATGKVAGPELTDKDGNTYFCLKASEYEAHGQGPIKFVIEPFTIPDQTYVEVIFESGGGSSLVTTTSASTTTEGQTDTKATVIPEFPSYIVLPIFMIATLLPVIVYRRKHQTRNKKREV